MINDNAEILEEDIQTPEECVKWIMQNLRNDLKKTKCEVEIDGDKLMT